MIISFVQFLNWLFGAIGCLGNYSQLAIPAMSWPNGGATGCSCRELAERWGTSVQLLQLKTIST